MASGHFKELKREKMKEREVERKKNGAFFSISVNFNSCECLNDHIDLFIEVSTKQYPKHWRFEEAHISSLRLGIGYAVDSLNAKDIHLIPFEDEPWQSMVVRDIRKELGINKEELRAYFRKDTLLVPGTEASRRLDTCAQRDDVAINHDENTPLRHD